MAEIVNHVARGRPNSKQQRNRYRQGVRRVIRALVEATIAAARLVGEAFREKRA